MSFNSRLLLVFGLASVLLASSAVGSDASIGAIADTGWEWSNPKPQGNHLVAAVADNGVRIAVGTSGTIIASTDNVRWKVANGDSEYDLYDVIWANGLFVAVGGERGFEFSVEFGVVLTSSDGFNWVERHRIDYFMPTTVIWDGTRFVALGNGSRVLVSPDGVSWSDEAVELANWEIMDLVWDGSRYVAVGNAFFGGGSVFESEDAVAWHELPFECECNLEAIAWGNDSYVAVGYAWTGWGGVLVSTDAQNWDLLSLENVGTLNDVIHVTEGFLSVGDSGFVARSPDGSTWSILDTPADGTIYGVAEDENGYLFVGRGGFTMISQDGLEWEEISSDSLNVYRTFAINEMAVGGDVFVGVGDYSLIVRSEDGVNWLTNPSWGMGFYNSVVWIGSEFWAVADFGIARSPAGLDWELMLYDTDLRLSDISWNGEIYVAVGGIATPEELVSLVTTSTDGSEWIHQSIDAGGLIKAVRWTGSRFVAVGDHGVHLTSPDGHSWTQHPRDEAVHMVDMEWNGQTLVAVGSRWEEGGKIWHSDDGISWQESLPSDDYVGGFRDLAWTGSQFVAVGNSIGSRIFSSVDGVHWGFESIGIGIAPRAVCGDEYSLHMAALGGKIIRRELRREPPPPRRPSRRVAPSSNNGLAAEPSVVR